MEDSIHAKVILLTVTVLIAVGFAVLVIRGSEKPNQPNTTGMWIRATKIIADDAYWKVTPYWNLTEPDTYTLEAVNNVGTWIFVDEYALLDQLSEHGFIQTIRFEDGYYYLEVAFINISPR